MHTITSDTNTNNATTSKGLTPIFKTDEFISLFFPNTFTFNQETFELEEKSTLMSQNNDAKKQSDDGPEKRQSETKVVKTLGFRQQRAKSRLFSIDVIKKQKELQSLLRVSLT